MTMSKNSFMNITHPKSVYKGEMFLHTIFESSNYLPQQMWLYIYYSLISTISTTFILKNKFKKSFIILFSLLILYISLFPQHFDNTPAWATQGSILSLIIGNLIFYKDRIHIKLITSIISILLIFITDYLGYYIVVVLFNNKENYLKEPYVYLISSVIIIFFNSLFILLWNKLYRKNVDNFFKNNIVFFILLITIEIMFISFWLIDHESIWQYLPYDFKNTNRSFIYLYIFMFIVLDCIIFYFTKSSSLYAKIKTKNEMLEYQNELQGEYYEKMLENYDKTAKLRHDINNLVQVINVQLSYNTVESRKKAKEIIIGISDIMESTKKRKFCNNRIVNTVLFDKMSVAEKESIKIIDNIILEENINITDFDICRIFINLLDNSINALKNYKGNDKIIYISCREDNNCIYIKCENKFLKSIKKSKQNSELHGFGLRIIKVIAEKYHGDLIIETQNYTFSALVVLKTL